jgi:hypothetical protein
MASSNFATGYSRASPGIIQPNRLIACATHSWSETSAVRSHSDGCVTPDPKPNFMSSHMAPVSNRSKSSPITIASRIFAPSVMRCINAGARIWS